MRIRYGLLLLPALFIGAMAGYAQNNTSYPEAGLTIKVDTTLSENGQFLSRIRQAYYILGRITGAADRVIDTKEMEDKLPDIDSNLSIISESVNKRDKRENIRNLQLFQLLTQDMLDDLRDWQSTLEDYNKTLINMESDVAALTKDSLLHNSNKELNALYAKQLKEIRWRLRYADSITSTTLDKIDHLQTKISDDYMTATDLRKRIRRKISGFSEKITSPEYSYLWESDTSETQGQLSRQALPRERNIIRYYFKNSWEERAEMAVLWLVFVSWVFVSFLLLKKKNKTLPQQGFKVYFLKPVAVFSGLVLVLVLAPFFALHPPAIYVDMLQFCLLISLTVLLWKTWPRERFLTWISIVILFFLFSFVPVFLNSVYAQRLLFLVLDILTIAVSIVLYRQVGKKWSLTRLIKAVIIITIVVNGLGVLANIFGRVTLSQMLSNAAIFSLTQIIALSVFMQVVYEAIFLQLFKKYSTGGGNAEVEFTTVEKRIKPVLTALCFLLWLIVFTTNINLYDTIYATVDHFLEKKRSIGNTSFSYAGILVFFIIIYAANFIQKNIGYVWGRTSDEQVPSKRSKMGSRLLFMRVILLTIGFLLAVAASGLPVDKITIVLGALGVGIGLGLQNIVNNLVSGIFLIFERPIEVGDTIEIGGREGAVKEIGLRSSTLISREGSEIIVPNGDFLSQHIVNWTLSNAHVRMDIPLQIAADSDLAAVSTIITEEIKHHTGVMQDRSVAVIVNNMDASQTSLTVYFWCSDIRKSERLRSDVLKDIRTKLLSGGIHVL